MEDIDPDTPREAAAVDLRLNVGTIPHLGDPYEVGSESHPQGNELTVFPIKVSYPILPENPDDPEAEMDFGEPTLIGECAVDESLDVVYRTPLSVLDKRIQRVKEELGIAED